MCSLFFKSRSYDLFPESCFIVSSHQAAACCGLATRLSRSCINACLTEPLLMKPSMPHSLPFVSYKLFALKVSMTTLVNGESRLMHRVASKPSCLGIFMSISTKSGRCRAACVTTSSPFCASLTISTPCRHCRNEATDLRKTAWSSASITFMFVMVLSPVFKKNCTEFSSDRGHEVRDYRVYLCARLHGFVQKKQCFIAPSLYKNDPIPTDRLRSLRSRPLRRDGVNAWISRIVIFVYCH